MQDNLPDHYNYLTRLLQLISANYGKNIALNVLVLGDSDSSFQALLNGSADFVGKKLQKLRMKLKFGELGPNFGIGALFKGQPRTYAFQTSCTTLSSVVDIAIVSSLGINSFQQLQAYSNTHAISVCMEILLFPNHISAWNCRSSFLSERAGSSSLCNNHKFCDGD